LPFRRHYAADYCQHFTPFMIFIAIAFLSLFLIRFIFDFRHAIAMPPPFHCFSFSLLLRAMHAGALHDFG
jgi:hypothetical protein